MMSYWVLFIGIAGRDLGVLLEFAEQIQEVLQDPYRQWHDRTRRGFEDVA